MARAVAVWVLLMLCETTNGAFREVFLTQLTGAERARVISFIIALCLISLITYASVNWINAGSVRAFLLVGILWAIATLGFELAIGSLFFGLTYERFAADYDPRAGGLMLFGLAFLTIVPAAAFSLRRVPVRVR